MSVEEAGYLIKCVRGKLVVVVQQGDELSGCQGQGMVGGRRDSFITRGVGHLDSWILRRGPSEARSNLLSSRAVVTNAKLPLSILLLADRLQNPLQENRLRVINRHDQADQGARRERAGVCGSFRQLLGLETF